MKICSTCGATVIFGGKKHGDLVFCNKECAANAEGVDQVPEAEALLFAAKIHSGNCPKCSDIGPVDVRISHQVWSALIMSQWKSTPQISCRKCGLKAQRDDLLVSLVAGWWGFPWGIIMTPIQIARNINAMVSPPDPSTPSKQLVQRARLILAQHRTSE